MYVIFLGGPAVGKGTQCRRLAEYLQALHISTGALLREATRENTPAARGIARLIDAGDLVPDELVLELVAAQLQKLSSQTNCLFDGMPLTVRQAELLDALLVNLNSTIDLAIELHASEEVLAQRMRHRAGLEDRIDDTPDTFHHRLQLYRRQAQPILEYYRERGVLNSIEATGSSEQVFESIQRCVLATYRAV